MRAIVLAGLLCVGAAGCNTVEGFGRDVSATGKAISSAAHDTGAGKTHPRTGSRSGPPNRTP